MKLIVKDRELRHGVLVLGEFRQIRKSRKFRNSAISDEFEAALLAVRCRTRDQQQQTLNAKLRGHYQYYGRPTNSRSLWQFYRAVRRTWQKWLSRRTRGKEMTWTKYTDFLRDHPLLLPWITHSWNCAGSRV